VAGLGWLGLAQPMWAELDPAQKKMKIEKNRKNRKNRKIKKVEKIKKNMCMRKNKFIFIYLFTGARVGNKKY
jgi:hypothetical protein